MSLVPNINQAVLDKSKARARERGIELPTFAQMKDPGLVPGHISKRLKDVGLWDVDPANLFRITWKNEPVEHGGGFNNGNWIEFPQARAQGRRSIRLSRAKPRHRQLRPGKSESRLAVDG
jgi:hypothetical protein